MAIIAALLLFCLSPLFSLRAAVASPLQNAALEITSPTKLVMPDDDDFYKPPPGFEATAPGTILKHRPVPNPLTLNNKDAIKPKAAWQFLFRTQNSLGKPIATVTTIIQPHGPPKPNNLFGYNFFSDASYNGCNPSVTMQTGAREDNLFNQAQVGMIVAALGRGFYVIVTDDGGPQAAFAAGLQSGYAQIDGFRAAKQSGNITGLGPDPIITMFGYSGGGVTAAWTTEVLSFYGSDVKIAGAALGGLVPNMTLGVEIYNKGERAKLTPPALLGLSHDYPNMSTWLTENLIPETAAEFRKADSQCFDSNEKQFAFQDIGKYFKRGWRSILDDPVPRSVMHSGATMGARAVPNVPWYLYETIWDDAAPVEVVDALADRYCRAGMSIHYERNAVVKLNHSEECVWGLPGAFAWLQERHDGRPLSIQHGCKVQNVSDYSLRSLAQGYLAKGLFDELFAWAGLPIRRYGS
ncbi:hypothetical protein E6O75_ATG00333 [Venturia nashicola]|uniref:Uncharacterized protein n=1 Tax=Venturia nashicola TaxID=86259 RepID=A0A4Z1PG39_9PEZI|nr:hypothetical protein E6O75_ATG00333 [Venturia nashicola]